MDMPINLKTENSLLQSMIRIPNLIDYALTHHIKTLAITDNRMYGVMEFYKNCMAHDIKPIIGLEIELDQKKILLYCENEDGYHNLIQLSTISSTRELNLNDLTSHSTFLICVIPFSSKSLDLELKQIYSLLFYSYQTIEERNQLEGLPTIYANEVLCFEEKDQPYLSYLSAIQNGQTLDKIENDEKIHFITPIPVEEDRKNLQTFIEHCDIHLTFHQDLLPVYECPNEQTSFSYLKTLSIQGLKRIFGETVNKAYIDRLKYELSVIQNMGFCDYFLVVWDYVTYAKEHDILVGPGRGSAAGSLVSYCLGITTVDPIQYNLLFERFLNPERITMPDIDIDFEFQKRGDVIRYCTEKYGEKRVVPIITFGTLGAKQVVRDVGRVMQIELKSIDFLCKLLDSRLTLQENYQQSKKLQDFLNVNQEMRQLYQVSTKLEGMKRHASIHAAGVVMSNIDLDQVIPLDKNHEGFYTTAYSMEYLEEIGLLKMDFLALRNLTTIHDILNEIEGLEFDNIPLNDESALNVFTQVNTIGIFQFESNGMMNFLRKFRPTTFEDIFAALALFRPGPMDNIDSYIKRKRGQEPIDYFDPSLVHILKPTYGIIVYQEQIMQIASTLAGYSLGEADVLRRAMSKKKESVLLHEKDKFISRSIELGYQSETATKVYQLILKFASYGFNRSHSVAYAFISYRMAYLKAHYSNIFMKHLLSSVIGSEIKTKEYIYECKLNHIEVLKPDINLSEQDYIIEESNIRYPLSNIRNIGYGVVTAILEERKKGMFYDIFDFMKRCYGKIVNTKVIENLIYAGCFQTFNHNKRTLIEALESIVNYGEVGALLDEESLKPYLTDMEEFSKEEQMKQELLVFGFYLSNHPITEYRLKYPNTISIADIDSYFDKDIEIVVYVDYVKEISTKKNEKMGFVTGSDEVNQIDIVLFPRIFKEYPQLEIGDIVKISGHVEKRFDKLQVIVNRLEYLNTK